MALGDISRIESTFAEAAVEPVLWNRALDVATRKTGGFGTTLLPVSGVAIPNPPVTEATRGVSEHYFRDGRHLRDQLMAGLAAPVALPRLNKRPLLAYPARLAAVVGQGD